MIWTTSCTVTNNDGNSRLVSATRLRWHDAALHAASALLYLSAGLIWTTNPLLAGWEVWVLAAGTGFTLMGIAMATGMDGSGDVGKLAAWLGGGVTLAGLGQGAMGPDAAAAVRAIAGDSNANAWGPWLGLAALAAVLYYDPKSTRNVRRDPMPPRTDGNSPNA